MRGMREGVGAWRRVLVAAGAIGCLAGCASVAPRLYVNPQADMAYYRRVVVLPFANLSQQNLAGERVTRAFITELIIADRFRVIEPADFYTVLARIGGEPGGDGTYDPEKLRQAAAQVEATGLIRGAVTEYQMQRFGQNELPVLGFDVELLDAATGNVVWRASIARRGSGRVPVIGGGGTRTLGRLTQETCAELVAELRKKAF